MSVHDEEAGANKALLVSVIFLLCVITLVAGLYSYNSSLFDMPERDVFERNREFRMSLSDAGETEGLWMSGYPAYASFDVPVPLDVEILGGEVQLLIDVDMHPDTAADLRISINNRRIHEEVLDPDRNLLRLTFPLESIDPDSSSLRIGLSTRGSSGSNLLCPGDMSTGIVLRVRPQSYISLDFNEPVSSVRDTLALMKKDIFLALPTDPDNTGWMDQATALAVTLRHAGFKPRFTALAPASDLLNSIGKSELIVLGRQELLEQLGFLQSVEADETAASIQAAYLPGKSFLAITNERDHQLSAILNPALRQLASVSHIEPVTLRPGRSSRAMQFRIPLPEFGVNTGIQQLRSRLAWNVSYSLADFPNGNIPESLTLDFKMPPAVDGHQDLLHVEMNGQLLGSRIPGKDELQSFHFKLPGENLKVQNTVSIILQRSSSGIACSSTDLSFPVQLMPTSALELQASYETGSDDFLDLFKKFSKGFSVLLPESAGGENAVQTMTVLLPVLSEFLAQGQWPDIQWVDPLTMAVPRTPYIALGFVPPRTSAKLLLSGQNLKLQDADSPESATLIHGVDKTLSVELVNTEFLHYNGLSHGKTPGIIVMYSDSHPKEISMNFGAQQALIFPDHGTALEILPNGSIRNQRAYRNNTEATYTLQ